MSMVGSTVDLGGDERGTFVFVPRNLPLALERCARFARFARFARGNPRHLWALGRFGTLTT